MEHPEHLSDSSVQRLAEADIVAALADSLNLELLAIPGRITLAGDVWVEVDARTPDNSVFVEAYARQGPLKGAQLKKIGQDILKLALLKREPSFAGSRAIPCSPATMRASPYADGCGEQRTPSGLSFSSLQFQRI